MSQIISLMETLVFTISIASLYIHLTLGALVIPSSPTTLLTTDLIICCCLSVREKSEVVCLDLAYFSAVSPSSTCDHLSTVKV